MTTDHTHALAELRADVLGRHQTLEQFAAAAREASTNAREEAVAIGRTLARARALAGVQYGYWRDALPEDIRTRERILRSAADAKVTDRQLHLALDLAPSAPPAKPRQVRPEGDGLDKAIALLTTRARAMGDDVTPAQLTALAPLYAEMYRLFEAQTPAQVGRWILGLAEMQVGGRRRKD